jgi:hypothetical protein
MRVAGRRRGVIAASIAIGLAAAGCGGQSESEHGLYAFGHMAGYVWVGQVSAVTASWSVPRITSEGEAHASTWIGAQAPGPPHRSPFIQVGTLEDRSAAGHPRYAAFWTDTRRGFHPEILFAVREGDAVSTALGLTGGHWRVSIADVTSGERSAFSTSEESAADFNLAEWLQEDPSDTSGKTTPYPGLSPPVGMRALTVNGTGPSYDDMFAQWMSLPGHALAPTPLADDAFTISPRTVSGPGRRYLVIVHAQNVSARKLDAEEARFTAHTPARAISRVCAAAAAAQSRYVHDLQSSSWPAAARGPIRALVRVVRVEMGMFATAARHPSSLAAWRRQLLELRPALLKLGHQVRRALGLPEPLTGQFTRGGTSSPPTAAPR